jgi:DNA-binding NarL/FixJ family response regulator
MAQASALRVLVAEDNADLRAAICALLAGEPDMEVAGEAATVPELLSLARSHDANVVVLDLNLCGESSVAAMRVLQEQRPRIAAVVYSGYDAADVSAGLAVLAPCAYVSKSCDGVELLAAIRRLGSDAAGARL